jgi:hypothetical protein
LPDYRPVYDATGPARWRRGIAYLLLLAGVWVLAGCMVLKFKGFRV